MFANYLCMTRLFTAWFVLLLKLVSQYFRRVSFLIPVVLANPSSPSCCGLLWHSPKKGRLRRQAITLTPPRSVKARGTAPWGSRMPVKAHFDQLPFEQGHTRPDPYTDKRSWSKCIPAQYLRESEAYSPLCWEEVSLFHYYYNNEDTRPWSFGERGKEWSLL